MLAAVKGGREARFTEIGEGGTFVCVSCLTVLGIIYHGLESGKGREREEEKYLQVSDPRLPQ